MQRIQLFVCLLVLGTVLGCGKTNTKASKKEGTETAEATENERYQEVMEIHDEVMPKMADLNRVKRQLKRKTSEMPEGPEKESINAIVTTITRAEEGMMDWMRNIQDRRPEVLREQGRSHEEIMEVLEEEKIAIQRVKTDMLGSLEAGQMALKHEAEQVVTDSL